MLLRKWWERSVKGWGDRGGFRSFEACEGGAQELGKTKLLLAWPIIQPRSSFRMYTLNFATPQVIKCFNVPGLELIHNGVLVSLSLI